MRLKGFLRSPLNGTNHHGGRENKSDCCQDSRMRERTELNGYDAFFVSVSLGAPHAMSPACQ